ncbi:MAG: carboxypeptidase-like regulatory domain-containing protein, partial [Candidatus Aminicenantes bacterium]|nr:carboxypeptidase-like regulatory domain-containing protein [Candidatus Aminicenantes bacterium]
MKKQKFLIMLTFILLFSTLAFSQAAGTRGSISGIVRSSDGITLAKAKVRISGPLLPGGREYVTTENGVFRFASLIPGKYKLEITHPEMIDLTLEVVVSLDRETQVEAIMVPVGKV